MRYRRTDVGRFCLSVLSISVFWHLLIGITQFRNWQPAWRFPYSDNFPSAMQTASRRIINGTEAYAVHPEGCVEINQTAPTWPQLEKSHPELTAGGRWAPKLGKPKSRVAIIVPYWNRSDNFRIFLQHMHPFLQKQSLDYEILLLEPLWNGTARELQFNRGLLRNVGFVEAMKQRDFDCAIFHDVDLLPENYLNNYTCPESGARHFCVAVDYHNYKPLGSGAVFGGIVGFKPEDFRKANGYSNLFFGWGGEDDDLLRRCKHHGVQITRPDAARGRYKGSPHSRSKRGKNTYKLYLTGKDRWDKDDGLRDLQYSIVKKEKRLLYTHILIDYDEATYEKRIDEYMALSAAKEAKKKPKPKKRKKRDKI